VPSFLERLRTFNDEDGIAASFSYRAWPYLKRVLFYRLPSPIDMQVKVRSVTPDLPSFDPLDDPSDTESLLIAGETTRKAEETDEQSEVCIVSSDYQRSEYYTDSETRYTIKLISYQEINEDISRSDFDIGDYYGDSEVIPEMPEEDTDPLLRRHTMVDSLQTTLEAIKQARRPGLCRA
jgi:hypothetical protein